MFNGTQEGFTDAGVAVSPVVMLVRGGKPGVGGVGAAVIVCLPLCGAGGVGGDQGVCLKGDTSVYHYVTLLLAGTSFCCSGTVALSLDSVMFPDASRFGKIIGSRRTALGCQQISASLESSLTISL